MEELRIGQWKGYFMEHCDLGIPNRWTNSKWPTDVGNYNMHNYPLMYFLSCFLFVINFQRHMHSICVRNMIKQSKPLQTRYDTTHIYDRYYIRTHVYVFLFSVKKRVFELSRVWLWMWPRGGTPYMVFIGPVFHYTIKTGLKRVGHVGYEWVEDEMCWFAEDMS